MTPDLTRFLHGETPAESFRHADHVRMGFEVLARHDFLDAALAIQTALKAMAGRAGAPGAYHTTVTLAFLALVAERRGKESETDFERFAAANPDLFDKHVLRRWYGDKLGQPLARRTFVLPDAPR